MRPTRQLTLASLLLGALFSLLSAPAASAKNGPIINDWWISLWAAVLAPQASPWGANDWNCKPSAAHPRPVILVHGTYSNMYSSFANLADPLRREGYCAYAFNYGEWPYGLGVFPAIRGIGPVRRSGRQLGWMVDKVQAATGAEQVDLVGFSQGGVVARTYLRYEGGANPADPSKNKVHTVVGLASANRGSTALLLNAVVVAMGITKRTHDVLGPSSRDLLPNSAFLNELNAGGDTEPGVHYTNIATRFDQINLPYKNSFLTAGPGATVDNVLLQDGCTLDLVDHFGLPYDKRTHGLVLKALDPNYAKPIPCNALRIPGLDARRSAAD